MDLDAILVVVDVTKCKALAVLMNGVAKGVRLADPSLPRSQSKGTADLKLLLFCDRSSSSCLSFNFSLITSGWPIEYDVKTSKGDVRKDELTE